MIPPNKTMFTNRGYFQLVRFLSMAVFGYFAYKASNEKNNNEFIIYLALAVLFQPLIKISLGRFIWNVVDVIVATGLIASIFINHKRKH